MFHELLIIIGKIIDRVLLFFLHFLAVEKQKKVIFINNMFCIVIIRITYRAQLIYLRAQR